MKNNKTLPFFTDSHAHVTMLVSEKALLPEDIARGAASAGVGRVIGVALRPEELDHYATLTPLFHQHGVALPLIAGIHPHDAKDFSGDLDWLREDREKICAIGEIGLDYHYDFSPRETQEKVFYALLDLAVELDKPIVIHGRAAEERILDILQEHPAGKEGRVLFHCFTGSPQTARRIADRGFLLSFSGILTFSSGSDLRTALTALSPEQVFFETDAPYLAPIPYRGKINKPEYVIETYRIAAACWGKEMPQLAAELEVTLRRFFGFSSAL